MNHEAREVSPPMDVNEQQQGVRKGRGWRVDPRQPHETALRADGPHMSRRDERRRKLSLSPSHSSSASYSSSDDDEPPHSSRRKRAPKVSRSEALLRSKGSVRTALQGPGVGILPAPPVAPTQDWACTVCSNWNSSQRDSCFRCSATYKDSLRTVQTRELRVEPIHGVSLHAVVQGLLSQLEVTGLHLSAEDLSAAVTPDGARAYFEFADIVTAAKVMAQLRCSLSLGAGAPTCPLRFSQDRYVHFHGPTRAACASSSPQHDGRPVHTTSPDTPPAAALPAHLSAEKWMPPTAFGSPDEEKSYLRVMSEHWSGLSAAQKAFYDERVRQALQSPNTEGVSSDGANQAAPETPSEPVTAAPVAAAPTSAVLSLKQRLAQRKAAKGTVTAAVSAEVATTAAAPTPTTGVTSQLLPTSAATEVQSNNVAERHDNVVHVFYGLPIPPCFCDAQTVRLPDQLVWTGVPLHIAEHILSPSLFSA